jgi:hypothetical protein
MKHPPTICLAVWCVVLLLLSAAGFFVSLSLDSGGMLKERFLGLSPAAPAPDPPEPPKLILVCCGGPTRHVDVQFADERFGIYCPRLSVPDDPNRSIRLTADSCGRTNNTIVQIEGYNCIFGPTPGVWWAKENGKRMKEVSIPGKDRYFAWQTVMDYEIPRIRVAQEVEITRGQESDKYDTVQVRYRIHNQDRVLHKVGLRVMLNPCFGTEVLPALSYSPGRYEWQKPLDNLAIFPRSNLPEYIQLLERSGSEWDLGVAQLRPTVPGFEAPDKMVFCRYPGNSNVGWDWKYEPLDHTNRGLTAPGPLDACVALYWDPVLIGPNGRRDWIGFTYGLSSEPAANVGTSVAGRMRLFCGKTFSLRKPTPITCYFKETNPEQKVTLHLPPGLEFFEEDTNEKLVPPPNEKGYSSVTWRVQAKRTGSFLLEADAPGIGVATEVGRSHYK